MPPIRIDSPGKALTGDQLPLPSASFDAVVIHQVLHFVEEPADVLAEAARVLRPGGRLLLTTLARHEHRSAVEAYGHVNLGFNERELRRFVDRAGLSLQSLNTVTREKRPPHFEVISLIALKPAAAAHVPPPARTGTPA